MERDKIKSLTGDGTKNWGIKTPASSRNIGLAGVLTPLFAQIK